MANSTPKSTISSSNSIHCMTPDKDSEQGSVDELLRALVGDRDIQCLLCEDVYKESDFLAHICEDHFGGYRPYKCGECNYWTANERMLCEVHLRDSSHLDGVEHFVLGGERNENIEFMIDMVYAHSLEAAEGGDEAKMTILERLQNTTQWLRSRIAAIDSGCVDDGADDMSEDEEDDSASSAIVIERDTHDSMLMEIQDSDRDDINTSYPAFDLATPDTQGDDLESPDPFGMVAPMQVPGEMQDVAMDQETIQENTVDPAESEITATLESILENAVASVGTDGMAAIQEEPQIAGQDLVQENAVSPTAFHQTSEVATSDGHMETLDATTEDTPMEKPDAIQEIQTKDPELDSHVVQETIDSESAEILTPEEKIEETTVPQQNAVVPEPAKECSVGQVAPEEIPVAPEVVQQFPVVPESQQKEPKVQQQEIPMDPILDKEIRATTDTSDSTQPKESAPTPTVPEEKSTVPSPTKRFQARKTIVRSMVERPASTGNQALVQPPAKQPRRNSEVLLNSTITKSNLRPSVDIDQTIMAGSDTDIDTTSSSDTSSPSHTAVKDDTKEESIGKPSINTSLVCDFCSFQGYNCGHLLDHYKKNHLVGYVPYKCSKSDACSYTTWRSRDMRHHMVIKHRKPSSIVMPLAKLDEDQKVGLEKAIVSLENKGIPCEELKQLQVM